jgi:integrase
MPKLTKTGTPGIYRRHTKGCGGGRCDCSYVVVWRHRGKQETETFRTFAEAREVKGNRDAGDSRPTSRIILGDYFDEWIETYSGRTSRGISERSRELYRRSAKDHFVARWRTWKLADVEPTDVRQLYGELRRKGASTSALRQLRSTLSAMFSTAVEDGLLRSNPVRGVRIPAPTTAEVDDDQAKALTREELRRFLGALPNDDWRLFFEFLVHTGLRISEAVGLRWEHLDLGKRPRVLVREQFYEGKRSRLKSRSGKRDVPLSPGMAERLSTKKEATYHEAAPVFVTSAGTELSRPNVASRILKPAAKAARVPRASFHSFRHTCASMLFEEGRNVKQVAEWLGHADPAFTLRTYVHLLDDGVGDADFFDGLPDPSQRGYASSSADGLCASDRR